MNPTCRDPKASILLTSVLATSFLLKAAACCAENGASAFIAELSAREDLSRNERAALLESHVKGMQKPAFLEFVKQAAAMDGLYQSEEARQWAMIFYARWYVEGPGSSESFQSNISLLQDRSLPWQWRWAMLDILNPKSHNDFTGEEIAAVSKILRETAGDAEEDSEELRYKAMSNLGNFLLTQAELIKVQVPNAKRMIIQQDAALLRMAQVQESPMLLNKVSAVLREVEAFRRQVDAAAIAANESQELRARIAALRSHWETQMSAD